MHQLDNIILPGGICKEDLRRFLLHAGKTYGWSALVDTAHAVVSGGSVRRSWHVSWHVSSYVSSYVSLHVSWLVSVPYVLMSFSGAISTLPSSCSRRPNCGPTKRCKTTKRTWGWRIRNWPCTCSLMRAGCTAYTLSLYGRITTPIKLESSLLSLLMLCWLILLFY